MTFERKICYTKIVFRLKSKANMKIQLIQNINLCCVEVSFSSVQETAFMQFNGLKLGDCMTNCQFVTLINKFGIKEFEFVLRIYLPISLLSPKPLTYPRYHAD